jgi:hypothetical protein
LNSSVEHIEPVSLTIISHHHVSLSTNITLQTHSDGKLPSSSHLFLFLFFHKMFEESCSCSSKIRTIIQESRSCGKMELTAEKSNEGYNLLYTIRTPICLELKLIIQKPLL